MIDFRHDQWRQRRDDLDSARKQKIAANWQLYSGQHPAPLAVKPGQIDDSTVVNLCRQIVDKGISFLVGKGVTWQADEQSGDSEVERAINAVWDANHKALLLHEIAQNGALAGMPFVKIDPRPDGTITLHNIDPAEMTVFTEPDDITQAWRYRIAFTAADRAGDEISYRQDFTRAEDGTSWAIDEYEQRAGGAWIKVESRSRTWPYAWPPIVHCKNRPSANSFWGDTDLEDADINAAINSVMSNRRKIARLHAHPKTFGTGFDASKLGPWPAEEIKGFPEGATVDNLTFDSDLQAARELYLDSRAALFSMAGQPDMTTFQGNLGALTNFGLRVLYADLLDRTETKRALYGGLIQTINQRIAELLDYGPGVRTKLVWGDPLPINELEQLQAAQFKQALGLVSDETLATELQYVYTDELRRIAAEQARKLDRMAAEQAVLHSQQERA